MSQTPPAVQVVSAGGVAFRRQAGRTEIALILVGPHARWQLPKGTVDPGESNEEAALREVREETGLSAEMVAPLRRIEYWFYAHRGGQRVRFHKFVHFYLMRFLAGSVEDHDHEVMEARWVEIGEAEAMLAYDSEKQMVRMARSMIERQNGAREGDDGSTASRTA